MTVGRTYGVSLIGLDGKIVEVEADLSPGLPAFSLVGLPDSSLLQARERVRSACGNSGLNVPARRITVNLSPASLPKRGSSFDVAIALAVLSAAREVDPVALDGWVLLGELGLDGGIRPVRGVLPAVLAAREAGFTRVLVPEANRAEAQLLSGIEVAAAEHLAQVIERFGGKPAPILPQVSGVTPPGSGHVSTHDAGDMADVVGQPMARLALEIAAAGGHHILLQGPPGSGKTMLAARLPGILPDLHESQALEVTAVHSLAGSYNPAQGLLLRPPYEDPHHTATLASIVGGGSGVPQPGAASRAHRGVLFLDEAPEFSRNVLEGLRQPLENGVLRLHRAAGSAEYPARFQLVMAANPCPCGLDSVRDSQCTCSSLERRRYASRLSGPILDRLDITFAVQRVAAHDLKSGEVGESTQVIRERIERARAAQQQRLAGTPWSVNAEVPGSYLRQHLKLPAQVRCDLDKGLEHGRITMRGYDRIMRVAWSLADLAGVGQPTREHISMASHYRQGAGA